MDPCRCGARKTRESLSSADRTWLPDTRARCAVTDGDRGGSDRSAAAFNYGLDKVRFLAPVKAGDRVRLRVALVNVEQKGGGVVLKTSNTLEIEGSDKPALIAESLALTTPRKPV